MGNEPQHGDSDPFESGCEQIAEHSKESIKRLQSLVDELKTVEEHEKSVLGEKPNAAGAGGS